MKLVNQIFLILLICASLSSKAQRKATILSPDKKIEFSFSLNNDKPSYTINYKGKPLIKESELSLEFKEGGRFSKDLSLLSAKKNKLEENYVLPIGKARNIHSESTGLLLELKEKSKPGRGINIAVRLFNDGVAFRYEFPKQDNWSAYSLTEELSSFNLVGDPKVRTLLFGKDYNNSHEGFYQKMPLSAIPANNLMDLPALFEYPEKVYVAITEASLRNYSGMYLMKKDGLLKSQLTPLPVDKDVMVKATLPHHTPWRVIMISDKAGTFLESNILTNLNEPSKQKDLSWLKPGKTSFHWWNGDVVPDSTFAPGINFETNKYYIDFCARNNIEYHSVIGYGGFAWYPANGPSYAEQGTYSDVTKTVASLDMQRICDYAKSKGVNIHVWINWKALYPQLEAAFTQFEKWGIKGMMVDFLDRSDQEMVNIQEEILERAAAHHLFIQFHGAFKPTGLNRTYPNEFTREGTLNYEQNKWLPKAISPDNDLDIAFVRLIAGASDYHLGGFRAVKTEDFKPKYIRPTMVGTRTHMLAMYVVLESYLTMVADYPQAYEGQPGFDFLQKVPTVWEDTKVINADLDNYLTIARKHGQDWYVGTINNSKARTLKIPFEFLDNGKYTAEIYMDAEDSYENPNHLIKLQQTVQKGEVLNIQLVAGGGCAIRLIKTDSGAGK
jgi:alpha-glucosidase